MPSFHEPLIINLFGGPGSGKSTTAAGTFAALKHAGVNAELVTEYAKEKVWEESFNTLSNQLYVFAKQHQRIHRLRSKVDCIVTDSPLLLSLHYGVDSTEAFHALVREEHNKLNSMNVIVQRAKAYNPAGRVQSESEARAIDASLDTILKSYSCLTVRGDENAARTVSLWALDRLRA